MPTSGFPTAPSKLYRDICKIGKLVSNQTSRLIVFHGLKGFLLEEKAVDLCVLPLLSQLCLALQEVTRIEERGLDVVFVIGVESQVSVGIYVLSVK